MRQRYAALAIFIWALIIIPQGVPAQDSSPPPSKPNCFEQAAVRLRPNQSIKLFLRDKSKIKGKFFGIDSVQSLLTMILIDGTDTSRFTYQMSDISKIRYRLSRGKSVVYGIFVGMASGVGSGLASLAFADDNQGELFAVSVGAGVAGGMLGGLIFKSPRDLKCK